MNKITITHIVGYENLYRVDTLGNIYRTSKKSGELVLFKQQKHKHGYKQVGLSKNGINKKKLVHRIVAEAFLPNPNKYPQVNHKDGNRTNNVIENLEWCTNSMNQIHCVYITKTHKNYGKFEGDSPKAMKIHQLDKKHGTLIKTWDSIKSAINAGVAHSMVYRALKDGSKSCNGFKWKYANA